MACSPCVLVLRHLEAFAQSTQAPENGKGEEKLGVCLSLNIARHHCRTCHCKCCSGLHTKYASCMEVERVSCNYLWNDEYGGKGSERIVGMFKA